ncbi:hypothetical protein NPX13_g6144 [Xylaria arbuscula]|uniref:Uncharacterized protein n=1 Tax=Xylaria arbuscula TaxID=114810 RepID=A0A9W8NCQ3_9PEZI|nr:hypothetical protein NPX13_g6144 [Xylaria arbuscula]
MAAQFVGTVGQNAFKHVEQNVNRWVNFSALKHYFNVTNGYVINKLFLVLFPWRHKPWSRKQAVGPSGQEGWYLPPRDDINSPDMYIPVMALVTYVLLSTLLAGLRGQFQPELLGYTASKAGVVVVVEILLLRLGCYFLSISNESQLLDLVAYSGYKFVGIIVTVAIAELVNGGKGTGGWVGWSVFFYTFLANSLFLMRSLRFEDEAKPENTISLRIFLPGSVDVHVHTVLKWTQRLGRQPDSLVKPLVFDLVPIFQFVLYAFVNIPPNFLWQEFLESTFPAYHVSPTPEAVASAAANNEKELDREAKEGKLVEPKLNKTNTAIKLILDQTIGAAVNTFLFSLFIHSIQAAMSRPLGAPLSNPDKSLQYLLTKGAIDYGKVDWTRVVTNSRHEFYPIMAAGWKLWPFVSLINFAFIQSIEGRNLVASLAGVAWGIYMSLLASQG